MFTLGVIPARGGSKRLPKKNIRPLCGKPLIQWTIDAARWSKLNSIIVSTDDVEIARVAIDVGGFVPGLRPAHLATDDASSVDVMINAAEWCRDNVQQPDYIILLQPTTPTRTTAHINEAIRILKATGVNSLMTVNDQHEPNGSIYATCWDQLVLDRRIFDDFMGHYWRQGDVVDIDDEEDWKRAERELCK